MERVAEIEAKLHTLEGFMKRQNTQTLQSEQLSAQVVELEHQYLHHVILLRAV